MATIYILKQGITLSRHNKRIVVKSGKKVESTYPEMDVEKIIIFGNTMLTPQLIDFVLTNNIETIFLSSTGKYKGRLLGSFSKNIPLRINQFDAFKDNTFCLSISKEFVHGKLRNCLALARRINWERKSKKVKTLITRLREKLEAVELQDDIDKLRGIEGIGANIYFNILREFVKNELFNFTERNKRPPEDPANALLSFLYTMLYQTVESALYSTGLDPFIGFFHSVEYGKPALALDLMEEFRPVMDRIFLRIANKGMLKLSDFKPVQFENRDKYGIYLSCDGLKKVVAIFQQELEKNYLYLKQNEELPLLSIIFEQARNLSRAIKREEKYIPFDLQL